MNFASAQVLGELKGYITQFTGSAGETMGQASTFLFALQIIVFLIISLYIHSVLGLWSDPLATLAIMILLFLVFFTDFWIFGTFWVTLLAIITVLMITSLGLVSVGP